MTERAGSHRPRNFVFLSSGSTLCWPSGAVNDNGGAVRQETPLPDALGSLHDPALLTYGFRGPALGYQYPPPPPKPPIAPDSVSPKELDSEKLLQDDELRLCGYRNPGQWGYDCLRDPTKT